jgi:hypothetical protein
MGRKVSLSVNSLSCITIRSPIIAESCVATPHSNGIILGE